MAQNEKIIKLLEEGKNLLPETADSVDNRLAKAVDPHRKFMTSVAEMDAQLATAEKIVDLADQSVNVIKKIEVINALDNAGALVLEKAGNKVAYKLRTKKEIAEDRIYLANEAAHLAQAIFPEACKEADEVAKQIVGVVGGAAVDLLKGIIEGGADLIKIIKFEATKPRGSKVKVDRFQGCRVIYGGDTSYIQLGENLLFQLTPECVASCTYDRKKYKVALGHHHYYINVCYIDGSKSYIRVSKKHLKNLIPCGLVLPPDIEL